MQQKAKDQKHNRPEMAARATLRVTARPKRPRVTSWVRKAADHKTEQSRKAHESKSGETRKALEKESGANAKGTPQTNKDRGSVIRREHCKSQKTESTVTRTMYRGSE